jgi:hypothetical protein
MTTLMLDESSPAKPALDRELQAAERNAGPLTRLVDALFAPRTNVIPLRPRDPGTEFARELAIRDAVLERCRALRLCTQVVRTRYGTRPDDNGPRAA